MTRSCCPFASSGEVAVVNKPGSFGGADEPVGLDAGRPQAGLVAVDVDVERADWRRVLHRRIFAEQILRGDLVDARIIENRMQRGSQPSDRCTSSKVRSWTA